MSRHALPAPTSSAGRTDLAALTGLRGFAAVVVVVVHASGRTSYDWVGIHGFGPVALFTLSGFLLFGPWGRWLISTRERPSVRQFTRRRLFRIFPAYWAVLLFMLVAYPASRPLGIDGWFRAVTLTGTQASDGLRPGLEQTWSMGTELSWYVVLPFLGVAMALVCRRLAPRRALWTSIGILALTLPITVGYRIFVDAADLGPRFTWSFWLPGFLVCFGAGAIVAQLANGIAAGLIDRAPWRRLLGNSWLVAVLAVVLIVVCESPWGGPTGYVPATFAERSVRFACAALLALLLLAAVVLGRPESAIVRALSGRGIVALGRWSYGIYLWHLPVIVLLVDDFTYRSGVDGLVVFVSLVMGVSIILGAASYAWVEKPMMAWSKRVREPRVGSVYAGSSQPESA